MKWTSLNDLRTAYLKYFESKGHLSRGSYSLLPQNDPSLLLINAGMAPLKDYFTGAKEPPCKRMATCQKCIRTPDIERVGITARHATYFEMLGNFSFGDYFKKEAIEFSWEFLTKVLEIPENLLWPSVHEEDDESYDIWAHHIGVPEEHIVRLGKEDNFWEHGEGPCGPCSEIYFDRGEKYGCGSPDCKPGCDCDRFMEIWNNVFSQYYNDGNGNYTELVQKNIDTGMGLERLACVMQGVDSLFEVDSVRNILDRVCEVAGIKYGDDEKQDISIRVITDHIRSTTFMICDGVKPSNEGRGYVLRRLLRRAARHGKLININKPFLYELCDYVIKENIDAYPELGEKRDYIKKVIEMEEERFDATIDAGLSILDGMLKKNDKALSGDDAFKLYDTFGFPIDLTREIAKESGVTVDMEGFNRLMEEQRTRARAARNDVSSWDKSSQDFINGLEKTVFTGYKTLSGEAAVSAIIIDGEQTDSVSEGEFMLVLDSTSFYGEGGGQVGDTGVIEGEAFSARVIDTKKTDGIYLHVCEVTDGILKSGDKVTAKVDEARRRAIMRNHSAAHLLQAALRRVLGNHVEQAGSYVDAERVRFDFSHFAAVTPEELKRVEELVNEEILRGEDIVTRETDIESAKAEGAMALFGEKYGKVVRLVKMGDFSTELCGGTHLDNTAKAGLFKILTESSVAAGVRRIEGTTGLGVLKKMYEEEHEASETAKVLKAQNVQDAHSRAKSVMEEIASLKRENETLNAKLIALSMGDVEKGIEKIGEFETLFTEIKDADANTLRSTGDNLKDKHSSLIAVLYSNLSGKLSLNVIAGRDAVKAGANAGKIIKGLTAILGGGGGGRPDSAFAGAKDASRIPEAKAEFEKTVKSL